MSRVLVIGGYGNFGSFISKSLAKEASMKIIIAGRSLDKAKKLISETETVNPIEAVFLDINKNLNDVLHTAKPDIVIHTSGPFQSQGYDVALACIKQACHYIDLADARDFVASIAELDKRAKAANVLVISGASSVPCLTSALIDHYIQEFDALESVDYGITTAQKTARGLATTAAILAYTGKPFVSLVEGELSNLYGWQGLCARKYKDLGWRLLGYCDIPDLSLFPKRYPSLKTIRFYAGLEIPFIHIALWALSWLVRIGAIRNLQKYAPLLLRLSFMFDCLGSANSAFHMRLEGKSKNRQHKVINFELTAKSGDGPYIPCMPAILMAKKIVNQTQVEYGAFPCVGFISKDEYLNALAEMDIDWEESEGTK